MIASPALLLLATAAHAGLYEDGMAARARGDLDAAKAAFTRLLAEQPASAGALEGLSLTCLSTRDYEQALAHSKAYAAAKPDSAYPLGLVETALRRLNRDDEALDVAREAAKRDACDVRMLRKVEDGMRERRDGLFPRGSVYKSIGDEDLSSGRPQRLVYEGRSGAAEFRKRVSPRLAIVGGASVAEEAQRNDTAGFTYYDVLEQTYSGGLEGRPTDRLFWRAEYGQSLLSDVKGAGVGRTPFSRVKLRGEARYWDADFRVSAYRAPYFLRGAGGSRFFALLREAGAKAEVETYRFGPGLLARASIADYSERTTLKSWLLQASEERWGWLLQPAYSHSWTDFYGAAPDGRMRYVMTDRLGLRARRLVEDVYRLTGSYGYVWHRDGNRLHDVNAEAVAWLPWLKDACGSRPLSAGYRFESQDYLVGADGYRSTDRRAHALGAYWRQGWGRGAWTMLGWEHSFLDDSRGGYEGNSYLAELEAYRGGDLSLTATGRVGVSTIRDESYSAGVNARWSF